MSLFSQSRPKSNPAALQQLKSWIYDLLKLDPDPLVQAVVCSLSSPWYIELQVHRSLSEYITALVWDRLWRRDEVMGAVPYSIRPEP